MILLLLYTTWNMDNVCIPINVKNTLFKFKAAYISN